MRQRVRRAIDALADQPRPAKSKKLDVPDLEREVRRLRIEHWRIVYAVCDSERVVDVFAVRKRPPYDYGDLETLLQDLG
jgi:mRNA interferase RelE/StbE